MKEHAKEFFDAAGCVIEEIVVHPVLADGLEQAVWKATEFAIANEMKVTVRFDKREFKIDPRAFIRSLFDAERGDT